MDWGISGMSHCHQIPATSSFCLSASGPYLQHPQSTPYKGLLVFEESIPITVITLRYASVVKPQTFQIVYRFVQKNLVVIKRQVFALPKIEQHQPN